MVFEEIDKQIQYRRRMPNRAFAVVHIRAIAVKPRVAAAILANKTHALIEQLLDMEIVCLIRRHFVIDDDCFTQIQKLDKAVGIEHTCTRFFIDVVIEHHRQKAAQNEHRIGIGAALGSLDLQQNFIPIKAVHIVKTFGIRPMLAFTDQLGGTDQRGQRKVGGQHGQSAVGRFVGGTDARQKRIAGINIIRIHQRIPVAENPEVVKVFHRDVVVEHNQINLLAVCHVVGNLLVDGEHAGTCRVVVVDGDGVVLAFAVEQTDGNLQSAQRIIVVISGGNDNVGFGCHRFYRNRVNQHNFGIVCNRVMADHSKRILVTHIDPLNIRSDDIHFRPVKQCFGRALCIISIKIQIVRVIQTVIGSEANESNEIGQFRHNRCADGLRCKIDHGIFHFYGIGIPI